MNVKQTLKQRNSVYGDYIGGVNLRVQLLDLIKKRYKRFHGEEMSQVSQSFLSDIINKLTRLSVSPSHQDSWIDIAGYATLAANAIKEGKNADKQ